MNYLKDALALIFGGITIVTVLIILFAWGLSLHNMAALLGLPLYMFYMNLFQIKPEERQLESYFGDTYRDYKKRVGRWW